MDRLAAESGSNVRRTIGVIIRGVALDLVAELDSDIAALEGSDEEA